MPILAYGLGNSHTLNSFPPAFIEWVGSYAAQIEELAQAKTVVSDNQTLWQQLLSGNCDPDVRQDRLIAPLLATNWDQGWPYNELCPVDPAGSGGHVYAGCVATAMAMVMKYWNHPTTGVGSNTYYASGYGYQSANFGATTYLWDQMPNSIGSSNIPVATLLYHLGVSVDMSYAPDGSGAQSADAAWAMANNFRYPEASYQGRMSYADAQWNALLKAQLDNGSPMYYSGSGAGGGHAFVIDGYEASNYYHFNFGWSGSLNGYYYMNAINPGGSSFNEWNGVIINTIPENYNIANTRIKLVTPGGASVGNNFALSVTTNPLLGSWNVNHYEFTLFYDHTFLNYTGASVENTISSSGALSVTETEPGSLLVSWNGSSSLFGGGTLATFSFTPLDAGDFLFDILDMRYNNSPVTNTEYLMVHVQAPVASLAESAISMSNVMHLGYQQVGTTEIRTSYLLPSWNISHYQFNLNYDATKLEFVGIDALGTLSEGLEPVAMVNNPGTVVISCDAGFPITGMGTLLKASFRAIGNGTGLSVTQVSTANFFFNTTQISSLGSANFILSAVTDVSDEVATPLPVLQIHPNPIVNEARLLFSGSKGQQTLVNVYNLRGQLVNTLVIPEPDREFVWEAKDNAGSRLSSGVYLFNWQQGQHCGSARVLILK